MSVEWAKLKRPGRWTKRSTWHGSICRAVLEDADAAKVTKHASRHDIEPWCREADGLLAGQLRDDEDE